MKEYWSRVEHVKAHRTKKEMLQVSVFESFIAKGNEKSDGFAQEGSLTDGGLMAQVRASTVQQGRKEGLCSNAKCSKLSLSGGRTERW